MELREQTDHQSQRKPGQKIQLAIFGANGPLSNPPTNYIYMREAKLEFYKGGVVPVAITPSEVNVEVLRKDPAIDAIVPPNPKISNSPRDSNSLKAQFGIAKAAISVQRSEQQHDLQVFA